MSTGTGAPRSDGEGHPIRTRQIALFLAAAVLVAACARPGPQEPAGAVRRPGETVPATSDQAQPEPGRPAANGTYRSGWRLIAGGPRPHVLNIAPDGSGMVVSIGGTVRLVDGLNGSGAPVLKDPEVEEISVSVGANPVQFRVGRTPWGPRLLELRPEVALSPDGSSAAVSQDGAIWVIKELRVAAQAKLPSYMVPAFFYQVDAIPFTANGKVDRQALLANGKALGAGEAAQKPTGDAELAVYEIWKQVLGTEAFGVHDAFFDVGGNSILLLQVHNLLQERYPGKTKIADLFTYPTIHQIAERLQTADAAQGGRSPEGLVLPAAFFGPNGGGARYRYSLPPEVYDRLVRIAGMERVDLAAVLQGLFLYVLAEATQADRVPLHMVTDGRARQVVLEHGAVTGFSQIFALIADAPGDGQSSFDLPQVGRARLQAGRSTAFVAFAEEGERPVDLTAYYDFGLLWRHTAGELRFTAQEGRLSKEKLSSLYSQYIGFLKLFADKYTAPEVGGLAE